MNLPRPHANLKLNQYLSPQKLLYPPVTNTKTISLPTNYHSTDYHHTHFTHTQTNEEKNVEKNAKRTEKTKNSIHEYQSIISKNEIRVTQPTESEEE